jgi:hypothetical protein
MDLRRLRIGELLLGVAGTALIVSLFLDWYAPSLTGWEALGVLDVILVLVALTALSTTALTAALRVPAVPLALDGLVTLAGLLALLLVLFRVIDLPDGATSREVGLWIALLSTVGIVAGGALAMRDERLAAPGRYTDSTGRPVPRPPEIEPLPAPPPGGTT